MANKKIRGITVEIGGDTSKLGDALKNVEQKTNGLQGELREVERLLKFDPSNTELLAQKQKILTEAVEQTTKKLDTLKEAEAQVIAQFEKGDIGEDQLRAFQREIEKTKQELDGFSDKLDGASEDIEDVGDAAEQSGDGFTVMKGALADLVASAITSAISAIGDLVSSLLELSEATEEYRTMQAKLEGSAKTFGYSVEFASSKYEEFYKYLGDDQASTNAITNLMGVGASTETLSALAEGATGVWASYGDSIPIESLTEAINETVNAGKVTGTFADTINWCKDANTNLNSALSGNKEAQKAYNDAIKEGLPAEDAFNEALGKITSNQERADVVAKFLNTTYGESKKTYDDLNKSVLDANSAEVKLKDTQAQLGETLAPVNNAMTELKTKALQAIAPLVEKLANAFMDLIGWLQQHPTVLKIVTAAAIALGTAFGILATVLAIQGLIKGVTMAFQFLNTTLLANPIVLIIAAIAGLVAAFIYLWNNCDGFRQFFIDMWNDIKSVTQTCVNAIVNFFTVTIPNAWNSFISACSNMITSIGQFFAQLPGKVWSGITGAISAVGSWISNLWDKLVNGTKSAINATIQFFTELPRKIGYAIGFAIGTVINWVKNMINAIKTNVPKIINAVITFFKELPGKIWNAIVSAVTTIGNWCIQLKNKAVSGVTSLINSVVSFFKELPGKIKNAITSAVTAIGNWCVSMKNKAVSGVKSLVNSVVSFFRQLPGKIASAISSAVSAVGNWCSNMASKAKAGISKVVSTVVNTLKSIPSKVVSIGKDIVHGVWNGIKNAAGWIKDKVKGFASGIVDGMKDALGIHSPSTLFRDQVGKYIAEGIGVGVSENADTPIDAMKSLGDDMANQELAINGATIDRKLNTTFNADVTGQASGGGIESLLSKLDGIYEKLGRLQVVLDTGTLVGETIEKIDAGLATRQSLSARGV